MRFLNLKSCTMCAQGSAHPLGDGAQAGNNDRANSPIPGYLDLDFSFTAENTKGLAGLETGKSMADAHAALAEVHQVGMEFVDGAVFVERDLYLAFGRQARFDTAICKDRCVGGDQFNPVSLVTHGLKQNNAGCVTPQSTFVTIDAWTEVT